MASAYVQVYKNGETVRVHAIDAPDWLQQGWGLDPDHTAAEDEAAADPTGGKKPRSPKGKPLTQDPPPPVEE